MSILISPIHFQTFCADELYIIIIHLLTSNRESGGWKDEKNDQKTCEMMTMAGTFNQ